MFTSEGFEADQFLTFPPPPSKISVEILHELYFNFGHVKTFA